MIREGRPITAPAPGGTRQLAAWARERFALHAIEYPVPARANRLDFMLGALTLAALTLLALSGIVLTQFYNPTLLAARESLRYIITRTHL